MSERLLHKGYDSEGSVIPPPPKKGGVGGRKLVVSLKRLDDKTKLIGGKVPVIK